MKVFGGPWAKETGISAVSRSVRLSAVAAAGALALAACGGSSDASSSSDDSGATAAASTATSAAADGSATCDTLNVLSWESYHDQAWLDEFKTETGITVNVANVGSPDEMFAKLKAAPDQWDLALATSGWFNNYVNDGLLAPVDEAQVTALADMNLGFDWRDATSVDGVNYGILYNWGDQPLAWTDDAGTPANNWSILWDPQYAGKVSIFDDPTSVLPMIALGAGVQDPYNWTDADFDAVKAKLAELRPQIKRLTSGFDDQTQQFANGEAAVGYLNNIASVAALAADGKTLNVSNTVEGGVPAWSDNYAITTNAAATKADCAYKFINYTMSLPWQARFIASTGNSGILDYTQATSEEAVAAGLTAEKLAGTLIPATQDGDAFFKSMLFFQPVEDMQKRIDLWNEFKLGLG